MGFFSRLKEGLARTRVNLVGLFSGGVVDEDFFEELEESLIAADIGYRPTTLILQRLRDTVKLKGLKEREEVRLALRDEIERMLAPAQKPLDLDAAKPLVIMMAGVNGAGKTTTIGKIAKWLAARDKKVLLAAADTFRAAAREQLAVWGERNKIEVVSQNGGDPAAVVFDAVSAGIARGMDVVIADTAGRLPTQSNLMEELGRIRRSHRNLSSSRVRPLSSCFRNFLQPARFFATRKSASFTHIPFSTQIFLRRIVNKTKKRYIIPITHETVSCSPFKDRTEQWQRKFGLGSGDSDVRATPCTSLNSDCFRRCLKSSRDVTGMLPAGKPPQRNSPGDRSTLQERSC